MNEYLIFFAIYALFQRRELVLMRIGLIALFFVLLVLALLANSLFLVKIVFVFLSLVISNELFLLFKVFKMKPPQKVMEAKTASENLMTFPALLVYEEAVDGYDLARLLSKTQSGRFVIEKIGPHFDLYKANFGKEEILKKAFEVVKYIQGDYVREIDLFIAYLLLCEGESKMIEKSDLKEQDLIHLLSWARHKYFARKEEPFDVSFVGAGAFDFFIFGWNVETKKYARDLTSAVISYPFAPSVVGRTKEYERMLTVLEKSKGNSVLFVGEPGTGKTSLVSYFAYQSHVGEVPEKIAFKRIYELYVDRIMAGAQTQGELEERIYTLFADIRYSGDVLIYIQNLENILGQGGYHFDMSGSLFQYLEDGQLQIIATTTSSSYKTHLENKEYVKKFFESILLEEPDVETALSMIFEKVVEIELVHGISFTYGAVVASVDLSSSYVTDRYLPGKAIDFLEDVAAEAYLKKKYVVDKEDLVRKIEERTKIVLSAPTEEEKKTLLHLEEELHKRIVGQEEAVNAVASAVRRLRSGFATKKRPISVFLFLGPTGVGKTETAKALAATYFGDEKRMIRVDMSEYQSQDSVKRFLGSFPGEEYAPSEFIEQVKSHPFSLILLDEFEKAHMRILDVFLQVFDEGRLTDNLGRSISFINTIIIATSNAGAERIREYLKNNTDIQSMKGEILDYLQKKAIFRPELLNRFDEVILFKPLQELEIKEVTKLILASVFKLQEEKHIYITVDDSVIEKIAREGFDLTYGARNIRRYIQAHVEDYLSRQILEGTITKGSRVQLVVNEKGEIMAR